MWKILNQLLFLFIVHIDSKNVSSMTGGLDCSRMKNILGMVKQYKGDQLDFAENSLLDFMDECQRLQSSHKPTSSKLIQTYSPTRSKRKSKSKFNNSERMIFLSDLVWKLKAKSCVFVVNKEGLKSKMVD